MKYVIDMDEEEHNRIRHFCSFGDNNIPLGWFEIAKSKPLQEELEEIKADVINIADGRQSIKVKSVRNIIDKRVAELKGENNG